MTVPLATYVPFTYDGQRPNNEDYIKSNSDSTLFLVCDGMGGWDKGEVASQLVADSIADYLVQHPVDGINEAYLQQAITEAHKKLINYLNQNPLVSRMGTTLALLHLHPQGATIAHIGDSRVYHIRDGQILYRTTDHRQVLDMVKEGIITAEQAQTHPWRNRLSRSIAVQETPVDGQPTRPPDRADVEQLRDIQAGDYFFLCTDGVLEQVTDETLTACLHTDKPINDKLNDLLAYCEGRTKDNYSGCLVSIMKTFSDLPLQPRRNFWSWLGLTIGLFLASSSLYAQPPTTYAVAVGIADYQILTYRNGDLHFADRDATRFMQFLASRAGGNTPASHIRLLTNQRASKAAITEAMQLFRQARPQDRIIFFFSGHGLEGAFVPYDVQRNKPATLLTHRDIKEFFKASRAQTKLCIADACMSGSLKPGRTSPLGASHIPDNTSVATLLSSRSTQPSAENGRLAGGLFTHYLLAGLTGKADTDKNQLVTIRELYRYVAPHVKRGSRLKQAPVFSGKFSDDLLLSTLH